MEDLYCIKRNYTRKISTLPLPMNVEHPSLKSRPAYPSHAGIASMAVACLLVPLSPSYANEVPAKPSETSGTTVQRPPGVVVGTPAPSRDESSGDQDTRPRMTLGEMRAEPKPVPVPGRSRIEAPKKDGTGEGERVRAEGQTKIEPKDVPPVLKAGQVKVEPKERPPVYKGVVLQMPANLEDIPQPRRNGNQ